MIRTFKTSAPARCSATTVDAWYASMPLPSSGSASRTEEDDGALERDGRDRVGVAEQER